MEKSTKMGKSNFDDILNILGSHGWYQSYVGVLAGLGMFFLGFHTLANVFLSGVPAYWCGDDYHYNGREGDNGTIKVSFNNTDNYNSNISNHVILPGSANNNASQCRRQPANGSDSDFGELICEDWVYDSSVYGSTVVTKWDLVCSSEWLAALGQSTYMIGFTIGGITLGNLADLIGRKSVWLGSMVLLFLSAVGAAFMPNYWAFIAFRAISGIAVGGLITSGFVLVMELRGSMGRVWGSILCQAWFALGYMTLPGVAYFIRDYRYLQLTLGLAALLFLPYAWILDESPRWLMTKQKYSKALVIIKKAAKMNKTECPQELVGTDNDNNVYSCQKEKQMTGKKSYSIIAVLKYPSLRWRTFNTCFNWFVNSFVFYGLSMGSADLLGGPYLNLFLSGLMEFPCFFICALTVNKVGRRKTLSMFLLAAGLCCIVITFIQQDIARVVLSLLGKLCISGSFCIIYMYTVELFPTVVRNLLVGAGCTCARIGGTIAPFVLLTGHYWKPLPMLCFGGASLLAGLWSLVLPETLKQKLPDTLDEGEQFGKHTNGKSCIPCLNKEDSME